MKKKVLSMLLATAMVTGVLAGCGSSEPAASSEAPKSEAKTESKSEAKEEAPADDFQTITFSNEWWGNTENYIDENWFEQEIQDALNIELQLLRMDGDNMNSLMATGGMADTWWFSADRTQYLYDEGLVRTIPKAMVQEHAPSLVDFMTEYPIVEKMMENPENPDEYLCLRGVTTQFEYYTYSFMLRYDWIKELGIDLGVDVVQTADKMWLAEDLIPYDVLVEIARKFTFEDPDGNGENDTVGFSADGFHTYIFPGMYGLNTGVMEQNGEAELYYAMDEYKEMLIDFQGFYAEGIVDPDLINNDRNYNWNKVNENKCGMFQGSVGQLQWGTDRPPVTTWQLYPEAEFICVPGVVAKDGSTDRVRSIVDPSPAYGYCFVNANVDDAKLIKILQFWEYTVYQTEDMDRKFTVMYGDKGVDWDYDENGNYKKLSDRVKASGEDGIGTIMQCGQTKALQDVIMVNDLNRSTLDRWGKGGTWMKYQGFDYKKDIFNETNYTAVNSEVSGDLNAYVNNYKAQAILGQIDVEATWDEYLAELDRLGYNKLMAELDQLEPINDIVAGLKID